MMPTLEAKYILCKILVSDSVLRKDFFQQTVFIYRLVANCRIVADPMFA